MVYGEPLTLPGQFLTSSPPSPCFLNQLWKDMAKFVPPATRPVTEAEPSKTEAALQKTSFVYIRKGATSSALSPLYWGGPLQSDV